MLRTSSTTTLPSLKRGLVEEAEPIMKLEDKQMLMMRRPLRSAVILVLMLLSFAAFIMYDREEATSLRGSMQEAAVSPALVTNLNNASTIIDVQTDASPQQHRRVSYVTSFWARQRGSEEHPHRLEIRASLLANILNPHFDQVVIFLDGVNELGNCPAFLDSMVRLSRTLGITSFPTTSINHADLNSKVTCVGSNQGQPTYYQMFKNAVSDYVTGDIVVMANADQAFDDTIAYARHLNLEVLAAVGTRGYTDLISADTDYYYKEIVGRVLNPSNEKARRAPDNCIHTPNSVDTWIFHKSKLKNTLRPEPFQRRNRGGQVNWFYMNEMGAENAAMWALNECYQFQSYYNACDKIHSWHFHLTSKTHHSKGWTRVPPPYRNPLKDTNRCARGNCFLSSIPLEEERE